MFAVIPSYNHTCLLYTCLCWKCILITQRRPYQNCLTSYKKQHYLSHIEFFPGKKTRLKCKINIVYIMVIQRLSDTVVKPVVGKYILSSENPLYSRFVVLRNSVTKQIFSPYIQIYICRKPQGGTKVPLVVKPSVPPLRIFDRTS